MDCKGTLLTGHGLSSLDIIPLQPGLLGFSPQMAWIAMGPPGYSHKLLRVKQNSLIGNLGFNGVTTLSHYAKLNV